MTSFKRAALAALLTSTLLAAAPASALVWTEIGAGSSLATAEVTAAPGMPALDGIDGFLTSTRSFENVTTYEVDLFKIYIADFANFSASVVAPTDGDTALFLFDAQGKAVFANDDFVDLMPTLPANSASANGDYFLGIGLSGVRPVDGTGADLFTLDGTSGYMFGMPTSTEPLATWVDDYSRFDELDYTYSITLTGATVSAVPEPASALLLLLGIGGLVAGRTLRRGQQTA